ncbi:hypothetical protein HDU98_008908 [Podochytrium sp. JEL0797]|nr:hypothetical protein HDU98_008908 [Podochytrium sp. JEL0797]
MLKLREEMTAKMEQMIISLGGASHDGYTDASFPNLTTTTALTGAFSPTPLGAMFSPKAAVRTGTFSPTFDADSHDLAASRASHLDMGLRWTGGDYAVDVPANKSVASNVFSDKSAMRKLDSRRGSFLNGFSFMTSKPDLSGIMSPKHHPVNFNAEEDQSAQLERTKSRTSVRSMRSMPQTKPHGVKSASESPNTSKHTISPLSGATDAPPLPDASTESLSHRSTGPSGRALLGIQQSVGNSRRNSRRSSSLRMQLGLHALSSKAPSIMQKSTEEIEPDEPGKRSSTYSYVSSHNGSQNSVLSVESIEARDIRDIQAPVRFPDKPKFTLMSSQYSLQTIDSGDGSSSYRNSMDMGSSTGGLGSVGRKNSSLRTQVPLTSESADDISSTAATRLAKLKHSKSIKAVGLVERSRLGGGTPPLPTRFSLVPVSKVLSSDSMGDVQSLSPSVVSDAPPRGGTPPRQFETMKTYRPDIPLAPRKSIFSEIRDVDTNNTSSVQFHLKEIYRFCLISFLLPAFDNKGRNLTLDQFDDAEFESIRFWINGLHPKSYFSTAWDFTLAS